MTKKNASHYLNDVSRIASRRAAVNDFPKSITDKIESTPSFLINENPLRRNLEILASVKKRTGAKILIALKAFATYQTFPIIREYLDGVCASGPIEARLGKELFGKDVHTFGPAYSEEDIKKLLRYSDTIIFNSIRQWKKYRKAIANCGRKIEIGLRVNPKYSEIETALYDPALPEAGLGILPEELEGEDLKGVDGLHFHVLCENNADSLLRVLKHFEKFYGKYIPHMKWINFGGGHHITRVDYDVDMLVKIIKNFKEKHKVQVHLEPGEAVVLNTGVLISKVLDVVHNNGSAKDSETAVAILDTSAEAHMPDVLAMPYKPDMIDAGEPGEKKYTYRLRGLTCLAGDIIGDYSFDKPLKEGDRMVFLDMALYTMVKTTTFNGIKLPSIAFYNAKTKKVETLKNFDYEAYKERL